MTKIEQIERKRLYSKLQDELVSIVSGAIECAPGISEQEADRILHIGEEVNTCLERYILSNELTQATSDDDSAIALTRRVVASLISISSLVITLTILPPKIASVNDY